MKEEIIEHLVKEKATPAYVFNIDDLIHRVTVIKTEIENAQLCFAIKANPFLVGILAPLVEKLEVCSPGEFQICKHEKVDMRKVVLSGVYKACEDIMDALEYGVRIFTVESMAQYRMLQECCEKMSVTIDVLLRLTAGNQFGMNVEDIEKIVDERETYRNLRIRGIQFYSGTQKSAPKINKELEEITLMLKEIEDSTAFKILELEYGPGMAIDYFKNVPDSDETLMKECAPFIRDMAKKYIVTLEMGRFLTAMCGEYITKVVDVKTNHEHTYCIVDGGINHVNYYGQVMGARTPPIKCYTRNYEGRFQKKNEDNSSENHKLSLCGALCTVADVLARDLPNVNVKEGDVIVFEKLGAYSVTEGIYLFLSRKMPKIYFMKDEELTMVRDSVESFMLNCIEKEN